MLTIGLIVILCCAVCYYFKKKLDFFKERGIPYSPGSFITGHMTPFILRQKHISDMITDIYNSHADAKYVGAFNFTSPVILLKDADLIKSVGIKNFENFYDHKRPSISLDPLIEANLINLTGSKWKEARSILSPAFTLSKMKSMYESIVFCAKNFVEYLSELPQSERNKMPTKELMQKFTSNVIGTCIFGIEVDSLKNPDDQFYLHACEAFEFESFLTKIKLSISVIFPKLLKSMNIRLVGDHVRNYFTQLVSSTVGFRDKKGISRPDMIQLMMDARGKSQHQKLDMDEMTALALAFFFGGFDTITLQICILAHQLTINPDIQQKLREEIDEVLERTEGRPNYEDISNMPYLDAVFNESMRCDTQAPFLDRVCTKDFELPPARPGGKPFTVKRGMVIWIPVLAIHRDSRYYEDPQKFDPERFYQKKVTGSDPTFLGFGIGPRGCIGSRLAILEIKILFFYLLSKFLLKPNENTTSTFVYDEADGQISTKGRYWPTIEPRDVKY